MIRFGFGKDREYWLFVNNAKLLERAMEMGYSNIALFPKDGLNDAEVSFLVESDIPIAIVSYNPETEYPGVWSCDRYKDNHINMVTYELYGRKTSDDHFINSIDDAVVHFPEIRDIEKLLAQLELIDETDYTDRCGNCHKYMDEKDKYCRYCGTKRGDGEFLPFRNIVQYVYGPPINVKYKCSVCGYEWLVSTLGSDSSKYCPMCGQKNIKELEKKTINLFDDIFGDEIW